MKRDPPISERSLFARIRDRLQGTGLAYATALVLIVSLFTVGLKAFQLAGLETSVGFGGTLELLRSEIFVAVFFAASAVGLWLLEMRRWIRWVGLGLLQLGAAYTVFANVVGYFFFQATGSALNWRIFVHGLAALSESPEVIHSEVPTVGWVLLGAGLLVTLVGPWVAARWMGRREGGSEPGDRPETKLGLIFVGAALLSVMVASIPAAHLDHEVGFSRNAGLHLVVTGFGSAFSDPQDGVEPRFDIRDARLEASGVEKPQNVAFVILESVRASATTPYNPQLDTTPHLDQLAEKSLFFEQAYAMVPHTSKALVAILCGVPPRIAMQIAESEPGGGPGPCLPTLLGDQGYKSIFLQSATEQFEARRGLVANMGYDDFIPLEEMDTEGYQEANYFGREDDIMLPYSKDWLRDVGDTPFLATYLTITPHHDYRAPDTYGLFEFSDHDVFNRYLNSVRYVDHFVDNLMEQYRELGVYDSTLFVIVGDHGEAFGEHGREQHDNVPWQEGIHIPMMIYDPGSSVKTERLSKTASHIDLVPTVVDLLGFELADGQYPGYAADDIPAGRTVFFSCWYDQQCAGFLHGGHKYIHHFGNRPDEVFDVLDDPREQHNLIADQRAPDPDATSLIFQWMEAVDSAYHLYLQTVINRRVLANRPSLAEDVDRRLGDAVRVTGYEWTDNSADGSPTLRIGLEVLRHFTIGDRPTFVVDDGSGDPLSRPAMRGVYPSLFWQQGQFLIDELPPTLVERAHNRSGTLYLGMGDERVEITEMSH